MHDFAGHCLRAYRDLQSPGLRPLRDRISRIPRPSMGGASSRDMFGEDSSRSPARERGGGDPHNELLDDSFLSDAEAPEFVSDRRVSLVQEAASGEFREEPRNGKNQESTSPRKRGESRGEAEKQVEEYGGEKNFLSQKKLRRVSLTEFGGADRGSGSEQATSENSSESSASQTRQREIPRSVSVKSRQESRQRQRQRRPLVDEDASSPSEEEPSNAARPPQKAKQASTFVPPPRAPAPPRERVTHSKSSAESPEEQAATPLGEVVSTAVQQPTASRTADHGQQHINYHGQQQPNSPLEEVTSVSVRAVSKTSSGNLQPMRESSRSRTSSKESAASATISSSRSTRELLAHSRNAVEHMSRISATSTTISKKPATPRASTASSNDSFDPSKEERLRDGEKMITTRRQARGGGAAGGETPSTRDVREKMGTTTSSGTTSVPRSSTREHYGPPPARSVSPRFPTAANPFIGGGGGGKAATATNSSRPLANGETRPLGRPPTAKPKPVMQQVKSMRSLNSASGQRPTFHHYMANPKHQQNPRGGHGLPRAPGAYNSQKTNGRRAEEFPGSSTAGGGHDPHHQLPGSMTRLQAKGGTKGNKHPGRQSLSATCDWMEDEVMGDLGLEDEFSDDECNHSYLSSASMLSQIRLQKRRLSSGGRCNVFPNMRAGRGEKGNFREADYGEEQSLLEEEGPPELLRREVVEQEEEELRSGGFRAAAGFSAPSRTATTAGVAVRDGAEGSARQLKERADPASRTASGRGGLGTIINATTSTRKPTYNSAANYPALSATSAGIGTARGGNPKPQPTPRGGSNTNNNQSTSLQQRPLRPMATRPGPLPQAGRGGGRGHHGGMASALATVSEKTGVEH